MLRTITGLLVFTMAVGLLQTANSQTTNTEQAHDSSEVASKSPQHSGNELTGINRVEKTSSMMIPTEKSIEKFRKRLEKNGSDYRSAVVLGRLYMRQAKENDDFEGFIRAEVTFRSALKVKPDFISGKAYLAEALMAQHRFAEAKKLAAEVVTADPQASLSLATLGDAQIQLGNYDEAKIAYEKLYSKSKSPPVFVRLARLKEITGNVDEAINLLNQAAVQQSQSAGLQSTEGWYIWRVGKAQLDSGKTELAKAQFEKAIELNPEDVASLTGLGFIAAAEGDHTKAIELFQTAIGFSEEPPIVTALGDVYTKIGQTDNADKAYQRVEELMDEEAKHPQAGPAHARERSLYFSDHNRRLPVALQLAQDDLAIRKDIYTYDTLAWALYKNKQFEAALEASKNAMKLGTLDAKILYHAGLIEIANGNSSTGKQHLRKALEINPEFSILESEVARKALDSIVQQLP